MPPDATRLAPFFPSIGPDVSATLAGFRLGDKGTHTSRTIMLPDLTALLATAAGDADREAYTRTIVEENCLEKPTASTRRLSNQRLGELYALDPDCAVFRVLRRLWRLDEASRPLLALLAALARDPLLMTTALPILALPPGAEMQRGAVRDALRRVVGDRLNDSTLAKVVRNTASSWAQAGHLEGRTFKIRRRVQPTAVSVAYALYLGRRAGFRGGELLSTGWTAALDCPPTQVRTLAGEAKRIGLIDLRSAGDVFELDVDRLDPDQKTGNWR